MVDAAAFVVSLVALGVSIASTVYGRVQARTAKWLASQPRFTVWAAAVVEEYRYELRVRLDGPRDLDLVEVIVQDGPLRFSRISTRDGQVRTVRVDPEMPGRRVRQNRLTVGQDAVWDVEFPALPAWDAPLDATTVTVVGRRGRETWSSVHVVEVPVIREVPAPLPRSAQGDRNTERG